jgi:hypothetical protein
MLSYAQVWTIVNSWQIRPWETRSRNLTALDNGLIRAESTGLSDIMRTRPTGRGGTHYPKLTRPLSTYRRECEVARARGSCSESKKPAV